MHGDVIVCVDGKVEDEPRVIEQDINQGQEQEVEPEPIPQQKPKRKRNYPQVGEPTLCEESEDTTERKSKGINVKTVLAGVMAVLMAVSTGVVMLAFAGAAVLFMPMLGGVYEK